jgi:hypothetical protein
VLRSAPVCGAWGALLGGGPDFTRLCNGCVTAVKWLCNGVTAAIDRPDHLIAATGHSVCRTRHYCWEVQPTGTRPRSAGVVEQSWGNGSARKEVHRGCPRWRCSETQRLLGACMEDGRSGDGGSGASNKA